MQPSVDEIHRALSREIETRLAGAGRRWTKAWFDVDAGDDWRSVGLEYQDGDGGEVRDDVDFDADVSDLFVALRGLTRHPDGRAWTRARFTLPRGGQPETRFEYPVPPPEAGRRYSQDEILDAIARCVRQDLANVPWTEGELEVGPNWVPYVHYRTADGAAGQVRDVNFLNQWLEVLWQARERDGDGPWASGRVVVKPGGGLEAAFVPAQPGPVAAPPAAVPLGELIAQIAGEVRHDAEHFARVLRESGKITGTWRSVRVTARWLVADRTAEVTYETAFTDGQLDEMTGFSEDVEGLFAQIYERLERGERPAAVSAHGVTVGQAAMPELTLTVTNERAEAG
jgi:hypothetical protein